MIRKDKEYMASPITRALESLAKLVEDANSVDPFDVSISITTSKMKEVTIDSDNSKSVRSSVASSSSSVKISVKGSDHSSSSKLSSASGSSHSLDSSNNYDDPKKKVIKHCTDFKRILIKDYTSNQRCISNV
jgi:hypothetical protein